MLVLKRKLNEAITIRRMWCPMDTAPRGEWILVKTTLGVVAWAMWPSDDDKWNVGGAWMAPECLAGWQPFPAAEPEVLTVTLCDVQRADRARLGFTAPLQYSILRSELIDA